MTTTEAQVEPHTKDGLDDHEVMHEGEPIRLHRDWGDQWLDS
jgi:hypothetical protein